MSVPDPWAAPADPAPYVGPPRAYWTSPDTWVDPDCIECGGEGAPCCEPPSTPPPGELSLYDTTDGPEA